jgi:hypothetical protein
MGATAQIPIDYVYNPSLDDYAGPAFADPSPAPEAARWWASNVLQGRPARSRVGARRPQRIERPLRARARDRRERKERLRTLTATMSIPTLLYHSVSNDPSTEAAPFSVTPETFRRQLTYLRMRGFASTTLSRLVTALREKTALPDRLVLVTVDDSFADFHTHVLRRSRNSSSLRPSTSPPGSSRMSAPPGASPGWPHAELESA